MGCFETKSCEDFIEGENCFSVDLGIYVDLEYQKYFIFTLSWQIMSSLGLAGQDNVSCGPDLAINMRKDSCGVELHHLELHKGSVS